MSSIFVFLFPIAFVSMLPALIKSSGKPKQSSIFGWVVISLFFLICANLSLIGIAAEIEHADMIACGEHFGGSSQLGGHCPLKYSQQTPLERAITNAFGGTFDGIYTILFGIPLVMILSLIGLFKNHTREGLYYSPYFAIFAVLTALILTLMISAYYN